MAVEPGVASKIVENTLVNIETELEINFSCNNDKASTGGTEEYTDDEYRYLLMHWKEVNLKGSLEAYEEYFANFDGIDSYKIVPFWNGTGTIKVLTRICRVKLLRQKKILQCLHRSVNLLIFMRWLMLI